MGTVLCPADRLNQTIKRASLEITTYGLQKLMLHSKNIKCYMRYVKI